MDAAERNAIVLKWRGLVLMMVRKFKDQVWRVGGADDAIQIGVLALMNAVEHYDATKSSAKFSTYASKAIFNNLKRVISEGGLVRVPDVSRRYGRVRQSTKDKAQTVFDAAYFKVNVERILEDREDREADLNEDLEVLRAAWAVLTLEERVVLDLRFWKDRSFKQIGVLLRLTKEGARKRVLDALAKLRAEVKRLGAD